MVDDTVIEKPHAKRLNEAGWVWSSKHNKAVYGVSVVLLVWSDGQRRIPIGFRVWKKGGPSKFELALERLSYARNRLKGKPQFVLFDAWYPSKALLKRIGDYGGYFVCRLKKNRGFEGTSLHKYLRQPYWQATGFLSGKIEDMHLPGFNFHALRAKPKRYSVHVNGLWCITFEFEKGDAWRVDLEQYH